MFKHVDILNCSPKWWYTAINIFLYVTCFYYARL